ncbi:MAG: SUMF1/EgtB/PvdO family nonheme iron enzyme [Deltaproteobacteria bacterium]
MSSDSYDVFLSHNSADKPVVEAIARRLQAEGLRPFLDKHLVPGRPWQEDLEVALGCSRTVAVFAGAEGFGGWHHEEMRSALADAVEAGKPVIPVLLPGGAKEKLPRFLRRRTWVDLSAGIEDLGRLIAGIRGEAPGSGSAAEKQRRHAARLQELYDEIDELRAAGGDTSTQVAETLAIKRHLRAGPQLHEGDVLADRYTLKRHLGKGGFATVWEAFDRRDRMRVAVKLLHGEHTKDQSRVDRFYRGARIMRSLEHPNIVRVLDARGEDDGHRFFVMEYVEGSDLAKEIKAKRLEPERLLDIMVEVGDAIAECHRQDIVHRDIKPANILLTVDGHAKVSDFDLVHVGDTTGGTRTGALGTIVYAAPECQEDASEADVRADVYGLSMTTIVGLRGRVPKLHTVYTPGALFRDLPASDALKGVLSNGVAIEREERQVDAEAWVAALRRARAATGVTARGIDPMLVHLARCCSPVPGDPIVGFETRERGIAVHVTSCPKAQQLDPERKVDVRWDAEGGVGIEAMGDSGSEAPSATLGSGDRASESSGGGVGGHADPESWADDEGVDDFGRWAEVRLLDTSFRMRWIPPGTFKMGSPEDEPGRWSDEGPQHRVTILEGLWLAETPCAQAVWQAVMGENPSYFVDPQRPVERVSWDDVQRFLARIGELRPGLGLRLPTEAEWEYACRAGTNDATYAGPIEILGERHAPVLDGIGWYGGNSGVQYDLEAAYDSSGWREKQYPHDKAGTRRLGIKTANPWGLYDTLGNVWEWCADGADSTLDAYPEGPRHDPVAPAGERPNRVMRGGSWRTYARDVRAAYRDADHRDDRYEDVGFRLARGRAQPGGAG